MNSISWGKHVVGHWGNYSRESTATKYYYLLDMGVKLSHGIPFLLLNRTLPSSILIFVLMSFINYKLFDPQLFPSPSIMSKSLSYRVHYPKSIGHRLPRDNWRHSSISVDHPICWSPIMKLSLSRESRDPIKWDYAVVCLFVLLSQLPNNCPFIHPLHILEQILDLTVTINKRWEMRYPDQGRFHDFF